MIRNNSEISLNDSAECSLMKKCSFASRRSKSRYSKFWRRVRIKMRSKYYIANPRRSDSESLERFISDKETCEYLPRFLIHPNSKKKLLWNFIIALTLIYTAFITSFTMAFIESDSLDYWEFIDLVMDFLYFFDFVINLNSAFFDSNGNLVVSRKRILIEYFKGWMVIDVISFIPFSFIGRQTGAETSNANRYVRFFRLPRLYKLFRMSRLLKLLNSKNTHEVIVRMQDYFSIKHSATRLFSSIASIIIAVHIVSCIWFYTSKIDEFSPDTWVIRYNYQDKDISTIYITCLYWAFTTLTTVGYGDISAYTPLEKVLSIVWMFSCLYFLAFTIGSLSSFLSNSHTKEKNLTNKLAAIDEFVHEANLPKTMSRKIKFALKYSAEASGFPSMLKENIFNELPKKLKHEVALAMHHGAARRLLFFKDKDSAVVSSIVPFLSPLYVRPSEFVYKQGDYSDEIYFVVRGWVNYVYLDKHVISSIYRNDYFGDIEVIFQINRKNSALAKRNLELLVMNRKLLGNIKTGYMSLWEEMKTVALGRDRKNKAEQGKLVRGSRNFVQRSLIIHDMKPVDPTLDDVSEQIKFLNEFGEGISRKFLKIKQLATDVLSSHINLEDLEDP